MNEFSIAMTQTGGTQSLAGSITGQVNSNKNGKNGDGTDFSAVFKDAGDKLSARQESPRKKDDTKPAEELVAYASAQQNVNNAQTAGKSEDSGETQSVEAVSDQTTVSAETPVADEAPEMTGDVVSGLDEALSDNQAVVAAVTTETDVSAVNELIAAMISNENEQLGAVAEAVLTDQNTQVTETDVPAETNTEVTTEVDTEINAGDTDVVQTEQTAVQEAPDTGEQPEETPDAEITMPVEKKDRERPEWAAVKQRIRERIEAYKAARQNGGDQAQMVESATSAESSEDVQNQGEPETVTAGTEVAAAAEGDTETQDTAAETDDNVKIYEYSGDAAPRVKQVDPLALKPVTAVTVQDVVNQLVEAFRTANINGSTIMEIQLQPAALGKVSILISSGDDGLTAQIKVPNDRVNNLLSAGLTDLMGTLKELGINMKNINVTQSELSWDFARGGMDGQQQQNQQNDQNENTFDRYEDGMPAHFPRNTVEAFRGVVSSAMYGGYYGNLARYPLYDEEVSVEYRA